MKAENAVFQVQAVVETEAVSADPEDDAADDPAIWYNAANPEQSLILGSDKTNGVDLFSLDGKRIASYRIGRINNVDLRQGWKDSLDVVGGSHRDNISMEFWLMDGDSLSLSHIGGVSSELEDVYGFCLYQSPKTQDLYAFVNSKTGDIEQWKLSITGDSINGEKVRTLKVPSQPEGMVADDSLAVIYVGEEGGGIHRFGAEPTDSLPSTRIPLSGDDNPAIQYDVEGLTIYYKSNGAGYLIASSQGNNTYAVFERSGENAYLGSFEITDGKVDGVSETDGIDVIQFPLGEKYPEGMFVCQDGFNFEGETKVAQNFKMVSWKSIESKLQK
ncbi:MAG: phytase [Cryomorphaceae bacterium]